MAEKLLAFSGSNWTNIGAHSYVNTSGNARAQSDPSSEDGWEHRYRQYFSVSGDVQAAILNLGISWVLYHRAGGSGAASFRVYLRKPDSSLILLASHDEDADIDDNTGSTQMCNDFDIAADMDVTGTYAIELWATVYSAWYSGPVYVQSVASWVGPPSLEVSERFTKTVAEGLGGDEPQHVMQAGLEELEAVGLAESWSKVGGWLEKISTQKMGLYEMLLKLVDVIKLEAAGLAELLERTYSYREHDVPGIPDGAGLAESLTATWETGNYTTEREILEDADIWETIPLPETNWEGV